MSWEENYKFWIKNIPFSEAKKIIENKSIEEREDSFGHKLDFGTAGIRGKIGYGDNRINEFTVAKYAYGYGQYLKNKFSQVKNDGVVVVCDNRDKGRLFTTVIAEVLIALGIKVSFFSEDRRQPTPLLSFTIKNNPFIGGINVTASHNPKEYSGMKFYDEHGLQVNDSIAKEIIKYSNQVKNIFSIEKDKDQRKINYLDEKYISNYIDTILKIIPFLDYHHNNNVRMVFSPSNGVSGHIAKIILKRMHVNYVFVESQKHPDSTFANTPYPNPQNVKAFDSAIKTAPTNNANLLFITDPDGDRYSVMVKHNKKWYFINGDQMPVIQLHYLLTNFKKRNIIEKHKWFIVKSMVSSRMSEKIADDFGIQHYETTTGFRWIMKKALEIEKNESDKKLLFAFEESIGSLYYGITNDKDALQNLYQVVEMVDFYFEQNKTLIDVLEEISDKYGHFLQSQMHYQFVNENDKNKFINHFKSLSKREKLFYLPVTKFEDFTNNNNPYFKNPLSFIYLGNNSRIGVRKSGTEPIVKIYLDLNEENSQVNKDLYTRIKEYFDNFFKTGNK